MILPHTFSPHTLLQMNNIRSRKLHPTASVRLWCSTNNDYINKHDFWLHIAFTTQWSEDFMHLHIRQRVFFGSQTNPKYDWEQYLWPQKMHSCLLCVNWPQCNSMQVHPDGWTVANFGNWYSMRLNEVTRWWFFFTFFAIFLVEMLLTEIFNTVLLKKIIRNNTLTAWTAKLLSLSLQMPHRLYLEMSIVRVKETRR